MEKKNELKLDLSAEVARGNYSNFAVISHSANEFCLDFVTVAPNMAQAQVQTRVFMTPENAKALLMALRDNVVKYEETFGEIIRKAPKNQPKNPNDLPNPFQA